MQALRADASCRRSPASSRATDRWSATSSKTSCTRFVHGGFHVLVSTTIIENGIDIPNVNTIIIDRADMYGISQLYQLRGRVGRSERLAYAYLFYPEKRALSELAMKRLAGHLRTSPSSAPGFKIALEGPGGAGSRKPSRAGAERRHPLGRFRPLSQAPRRRPSRELEESEEEGPPEPYLELEYTGYIPDYLHRRAGGEMEVYKKIAVGRHRGGARVGAGSELEDRFGTAAGRGEQPPRRSPRSASSARSSTSRASKERKGNVEIEFSKLAVVSPDRVLELIRAGGGKVRLDPNRPQVLRMETGSVGLKEKSEFIRSKLSSLL
ncbi:MAG: helicase-related protein [Halomonas sp.]|uniref:helicase-related protein n=1 Tax=Halomonas sp. TaxID=1486246 RepID=UPI002ACDB353|nr:helicase-related protein [Halomonas sp.]MDZ7852661.1 helicase-related protein [Halomonas sp.]